MGKRLNVIDGRWAGDMTRIDCDRSVTTCRESNLLVSPSLLTTLPINIQTTNVDVVRKIMYTF